MLAHLFYYLWLASFLVLRPLVVKTGGGDAAGGSASKRLRTATTRRRFTGFFAAQCEASRLHSFEFIVKFLSGCSVALLLFERSFGSQRFSLYFLWLATLLSSTLPKPTCLLLLLLSVCCCRRFCLSIVRGVSWSCRCAASSSSAALRAVVGKLLETVEDGTAVPVVAVSCSRCCPPGRALSNDVGLVL
ncbi:hypothetical protein IG631_24046 [Alternaria alternata]|nr:hypothetical protein IG631_24046 [Alternaria alternata]